MKRKLTITLELENDAFRNEAGATEAARILTGLAAGFVLDGFMDAGTETDSGAAGGLFDGNGNWSGFWRVILDDRLESDPYRWEHLQRAELEPLRTALFNRIAELSVRARDLKPEQRAERRVLEAMQRQLNLEIERRQ